MSPHYSEGLVGLKPKFAQIERHRDGSGAEAECEATPNQCAKVQPFDWLVATGFSKIAGQGLSLISAAKNWNSDAAVSRTAINSTLPTHPDVVLCR